MSHPQMYDQGDPVYRRVRDLALGLPGAAEKFGHGRPMFYTVKVFAYYGGSIKVDGAYVRHEHSILFVPDAEDREGLLNDSRVFRPAYVGPFGWLGLDLSLDMDWTEVAELLDASYRITAPRRLIAELDARR
jgi:hypothetical protein